MLGLLRGASFRPAGKTTRRRDRCVARSTTQASPRDPCLCRRRGRTPACRRVTPWPEAPPAGGALRAGGKPRGAGQRSKVWRLCSRAMSLRQRRQGKRLGTAARCTDHRRPHTRVRRVRCACPGGPWGTRSSALFFSSRVKNAALSQLGLRASDRAGHDGPITAPFRTLAGLMR